MAVLVAAQNEASISVLVCTDGHKEYTPEPVQFGTPRMHFTLLGYCLCLLYCLESFGATICGKQSFSL